MTDAKSRDLQRQAAAGGDTDAAAAVLREGMRAGELTQEHVELAASLGHGGAQVLCPEAELVDWSGWEARSGLIGEAVKLLGDNTLPARVAADWAERVLPAWDSWVPDHKHDWSPPEAIASARAWADCPCSEHTEEGFPIAAVLSVALVCTLPAVWVCQRKTVAVEEAPGA